MIFFEVLDELAGQLLELLVILALVLPGVDGVEDVGVNSFDLGGHLEAEAGHFGIFCFLEAAIVDRINDGPGHLKTHSLAFAIFATAPSGVNEPAMSSIGVNIFSQHLSISERMEGQESFSKAC